MRFESNRIKKEPGHVKLCAEMLVQFENKYCEDIQGGTPKWWDDYVLQNIKIEEYHIYFVCSCTLPKGQYNCVTDYKKVWGLNGLEQGIYDNTYINDSGKVYFGIVQTQGEEAFRSSVSTTILLVKKEFEIVCEDIFGIFQRYRYDFGFGNDSENIILTYVCGLYKDSILLRYNYMGEASLDIYGKNIEHIFPKLNISKYDDHEVEVVCRRP